MSNRKNIHVVPHPDGWAVKREGAERASAVLRTQEQAAGRARDIARPEHGEVFIHGKGSQIRERNSYGNDPFPPRDKR